MQEFLNDVGNQISLYGPRIMWAIVLFIVFYLASWIVGALIRSVGKRVEAHQVVVDLIAQVIGTTLLIVGIICVLGTLGVDVTGLVAGLGLIGFAVGFALKDVLSNVLSGVLILYYRPFWINDKIKVSGYEGTVADVDLRYTTLETKDSTVLVPNSSLFSNSVEILAKKAEEPPKQTVSAKIAEEKEAEKASK